MGKSHRVQLRISRCMFPSSGRNGTAPDNQIFSATRGSESRVQLLSAPQRCNPHPPSPCPFFLHTDTGLHARTLLHTETTPLRRAYGPSKVTVLKSLSLS